MARFLSSRGRTAVTTVSFPMGQGAGSAHSHHGLPVFRRLPRLGPPRGHPREGVVAASFSDLARSWSFPSLRVTPGCLWSAECGEAGSAPQPTAGRRRGSPKHRFVPQEAREDSPSCLAPPPASPQPRGDRPSFASSGQGRRTPREEHCAKPALPPGTRCGLHSSDPGRHQGTFLFGVGLWYLGPLGMGLLLSSSAPPLPRLSPRPQLLSPFHQPTPWGSPGPQCTGLCGQLCLVQIQLVP